MKICLVSAELPPETGWGGIGTYTDLMARGLAAQGHEVHVIARTIESEASCHVVAGVTIHRIPLPTMTTSHSLMYMRVAASLGYLHAVWETYRRLDREIGFDVVEAPDFGAESLHLRPRPETLLVVRLHTPTVLAVRYHSGRMGASDVDLDALERAAVMRADLVTAPSQMVADAVRAVWNLPDLDVRVGPNPMDVERFGVPASPDPERARKLLFVGRIEPRKGVLTIIRSVSRVLSEVPDARWTLVGRDSQLEGDSMIERLSAMLADAGVPDGTVTFLPHVDRNDLPALYAAHGVALAPSCFDNFPYSALEALAAGTALVVSNEVGVAEWLAPRGAGCVVPPADPEALANASLRLLTDPAAAREMGEHGRRWVQDVCSLDPVATRMAELYAEGLILKRARLSSERGSAPSPGPV